MVEEAASGIPLVRDTCNVYVLRNGREAVLVDFGSGAVLDRLGELGIDRVTDVLVTHHHRDQVQGLARAAEAGIRIWVPPAEEDLIAGVDERWRTRQVANDYDLREDRFSLLEQVPVTGAVWEYRTRDYGGVAVYALPTPGHTLGSVTYLVETGGRRVAFTGDLVHGDGQVWSLAATQWTYSGVEGWAATIVSCGVLRAREPDVLLPSHGDPIDEPDVALGRLAARMQELVDLRLPGGAWSLEERLRQPFVAITPHFLRNRTMFANSYALVSETGGALVIDFGYDLTCTATGSERAARRTLLWSLDGLRVEVVVPTHYHDDHVAGINLLREITGAEAWIPENIASVLGDPARYDLPCLWFDAVPADRVMALGEPVRWHEYELTAYALPGHTRYAAALAFEVDGKRVLATGDQQTNDDGRAILNFQYRNRFAADDFVRSAALYRELRPDIVVSGHWLPVEVTDAWLDRLLADGRRTAELHEELLPPDGLGTQGFGARIEPYRSAVAAGDSVELSVEVPRAPAEVRLVVPAGWSVEPDRVELAAPGDAHFRVTPAAVPVSRARVAADVTVDGTRLGQQAEALVDVR